METQRFSIYSAIITGVVLCIYASGCSTVSFKADSNTGGDRILKIISYMPIKSVYLNVQKCLEEGKTFITKNALANIKGEQDEVFNRLVQAGYLKSADGKRWFLNGDFLKIQRWLHVVYGDTDKEILHVLQQTRDGKEYNCPSITENLHQSLLQNSFDLVDAPYKADLQVNLTMRFFKKKKGQEDFLHFISSEGKSLSDRGVQFVDGLDVEVIFTSGRMSTTQIYRLYGKDIALLPELIIKDISAIQNK